MVTALFQVSVLNISQQCLYHFKHNSGDFNDVLLLFLMRGFLSHRRIDEPVKSIEEDGIFMNNAACLYTHRLFLHSSNYFQFQQIHPRTIISRSLI